MEIKKIVILGAGKLAHQLIPAILGKGYEISQIYNRSALRLNKLVKIYDIPHTTQLDSIQKNADLYIMCIKDDAIHPLALKISEFLPQDSFLVHTSGVKPISDLKMYKNYGLFYPLHSFTENDQQSFDHLPLVINANNQKSLRAIQYFAQSISSNIYTIEDHQRPYLHLAAVLANNFTNHLLGRSFELLKNNNIDIDILYPIIKEATLKALSNNPYKIQTGPAVRGDQSTIDTHLSLLEEDVQLQAIYRLLTQSIQDKKNHYY